MKNNLFAAGGFSPHGAAHSTPKISFNTTRLKPVRMVSPIQ